MSRTHGKARPLARLTSVSVRPFLTSQFAVPLRHSRQRLRRTRLCERDIKTFFPVTFFECEVIEEDDDCRSAETDLGEEKEG